MTTINSQAFFPIYILQRIVDVHKYGSKQVGKNPKPHELQPLTGIKICTIESGFELIATDDTIAIREQIVIEKPQYQMYFHIDDGFVIPYSGVRKIANWLKMVPILKNEYVKFNIVTMDQEINWYRISMEYANTSITIDHILCGESYYNISPRVFNVNPIPANIDSVDMFNLRKISRIGLDLRLMGRAVDYFDGDNVTIEHGRGLIIKPLNKHINHDKNCPVYVTNDKTVLIMPISLPD